MAEKPPFADILKGVSLLSRVHFFEQEVLRFRVKKKELREKYAGLIREERYNVRMTKELGDELKQCENGKRKKQVG